MACPAGTVQGDYVPEQKIKLRHGDLLMVSGLLDNIRLNFLRWVGALAGLSAGLPGLLPKLSCA